MWLFAEDETLKNMAGPWKYDKKKLSIPERGSEVEDFIKEKGTEFFLGTKMLSGKDLAGLIFLGPSNGESIVICTTSR